MNSSLHTSGPWEAIPLNPDQENTSVIAFRIQTKAPTHPDLADVFYRDEDGEAEANARLIADAPLGLELARQVVHASESGESIPSDILAGAMFYLHRHKMNPTSLSPSKPSYATAE